MGTSWAYGCIDPIGNRTCTVRPLPWNENTYPHCFLDEVGGMRDETSTSPPYLHLDPPSTQRGLGLRPLQIRQGLGGTHITHNVIVTLTGTFGNHHDCYSNMADGHGSARHSSTEQVTAMAVETRKR